jgi:hypothetical protein
MAPVAGGVSSTHQYHFIFPFGFVKGCTIPGMPVHRVVGMLKKIGAAFVDKSVGEFGHNQSFGK